MPETPTSHQETALGEAQVSAELRILSRGFETARQPAGLPTSLGYTPYSWSADGSRIFVTHREGEQISLGAIDVSSGVEQRLADLGNSTLQPGWPGLLGGPGVFRTLDSRGSVGG